MSQTNGKLQKSTVAALERVLAENRKLKQVAALKPAPYWHCRYCGHPVCGCGLEDMAP